jgi:hypothetical protein
VCNNIWREMATTIFRRVGCQNDSQADSWLKFLGVKILTFQNLMVKFPSAWVNDPPPHTHTHTWFSYSMCMSTSLDNICSVCLVIINLLYNSICIYRYRWNVLFMLKQELNVMTCKEIMTWWCKNRSILV